MSDRVSFEIDQIAKAPTHDLLQIATVDAGLIQRKRMRRSELRRALHVAHAIADLAEQSIQRLWDKSFYVVGNKVFMSFISGDLLSEQRAPVSELILLLEVFIRWRDARLTLAMAGIGSNSSPSDQLSEPVAQAREALRVARESPHGRSGNVDDLFLAWAGKWTRASEYQFNVANLDGSSVDVWMPPKARLLARSPATLGLPRGGSSGAGIQVRSRAQMVLVRTADGKKLLIAYDGSERLPEPGTRLCLPDGAAQAIAAWCLIKK